MSLVAEGVIKFRNVLLMPASLFVIHVVFGREICPLVTLLVPCVCWSERSSLRPKDFVNNLFFLDVAGCKVY
jgi:hypothetical protein